ncbi:MAG: hypothetical protein M1338_03780 [Patescibacteria group bacterium]|nr:hypothetical protein [Patescibacteria group bacterium]
MIKKIQSSLSGLSFLIENTSQTQILTFFDQLQTGLAVNDPDVYKLDSDSIKIKEIRDLQSFINLKPYNSNCKIALVLGADKLNLAAANALLKTLEEPPKKTFIFLSASSKDEVLPTIISRCQH